MRIPEDLRRVVDQLNEIHRQLAAHVASGTLTDVAEAHLTEAMQYARAARTSITACNLMPFTKEEEARPTPPLPRRQASPGEPAPA